MKRNISFMFIVVMGLIIIQPLQADTIAYNIQANFYAPDNSQGDPLNIGSNTGTVTFKFTASPPPYYFDNDPTYALTIYLPIDFSITLYGTIAYEIYTYAGESLGLVNARTGIDNSDLFSLDSRALISSPGGPLLDFYLYIDLGHFYWDDGEIPADPKLLIQNDILFVSGGINEVSSPDILSCYYFSTVLVNSAVVAPLPKSLMLLGSNLVALFGWRRFKKVKFKT